MTQEPEQVESSSAFSVQRSALPEVIVHRSTFPKSHHLRLPREFDAVYATKTRESRGPLTVYAKPNALNHPRLGMSVSRKVGIAARRNRIRRLLREAFRLTQHDLPRGYDLVVVVRAHEPAMLADYQRLLSGCAVRLHGVWQKRAAKVEKPDALPPVGGEATG